MRHFRSVWYSWVGMIGLWGMMSCSPLTPNFWPQILLESPKIVPLQGRSYSSSEIKTSAPKLNTEALIALKELDHQLRNSWKRFFYSKKRQTLLRYIDDLIQCLAQGDIPQASKSVWETSLDGLFLETLASKKREHQEKMIQIIEQCCAYHAPGFQSLFFQSIRRYLGPDSGYPCHEKLQNAALRSLREIYMQHVQDVLERDMEEILTRNFFLNPDLVLDLLLEITEQKPQLINASLLTKIQSFQRSVTVSRRFPSIVGNWITWKPEVLKVNLLMDLVNHESFDVSKPDDQKVIQQWVEAFRSPNNQSMVVDALQKLHGMTLSYARDSRQYKIAQRILEQLKEGFPEYAQDDSKSMV